MQHHPPTRFNCQALQIIHIVKERMKAIYLDEVYTIVSDTGLGVYLENFAWGQPIFVDYSDPDLIIDPTDDQIESIP